MGKEIYANLPATQEARAALAAQQQRLDEADDKRRAAQWDVEQVQEALDRAADPDETGRLRALISDRRAARDAWRKEVADREHDRDQAEQDLVRAELSVNGSFGHAWSAQIAQIKAEAELITAQRALADAKAQVANTKKRAAASLSAFKSAAGKDTDTQKFVDQLRWRQPPMGGAAAALEELKSKFRAAEFERHTAKQKAER